MGARTEAIRQRGTGKREDKSGNYAVAEAKRVAILVLGDIGRSPRMQYHAISLARAGYLVDFIGYAGAKPMNEVLSAPGIALHHVRVLPQPTSAPKALFYIYAPFKVLYQICALFWVLLAGIQRPRYILVQNPPAIPTLLVAQICAFMIGARLIIDWHNYGHTILALKLGPAHPVVSLATWFEHFFGKSAFAHLCVTNAMAADLQEKWKISGRLIVLHDKAPKHFKHLSAPEIQKLWTRLLDDPQMAGLRRLLPDTSDASDAASEQTSLLTQRLSDGKVAMRKNRPMLLVSSTSWTADEDFSVLLEALKTYDLAAQSKSNGSNLPSLAVLITGKGPLRAFYEEQIGRLRLASVCIVTAWLSAEDYPLLLGSADLGISLHTSSSGLDLPMKVVDMLGCGTPVCAYGFSCIRELVTERNGLVFSDAAELAQQIQSLACQLANQRGPYQRLLRGAEDFRCIDWDSNYAPVLQMLAEAVG
ncbi:mannosyltransferase [Coemansia sp. RSA 485]|nr:mannosyltransferase [Coemansia sp. RSA 485]